MLRQKIKKVMPWVLFCLAGVAFNVVGARLVAWLGLPLFLDSQGTVFVAAVGGYLPGIVVGYLSNLVNSAYDPISVFYCVTSVMIAGTATFFYQKGLFRKLPGLLLLVFVLAFLGGGLGSVMGWALYGFDIEGGVSGALAVRIYESGFFSPFTAKLIADFAIDVADKALTILVVLLALRFVPYRLEDALDVPLRRGSHSATSKAAPKSKSCAACPCEPKSRS